MNVRYSSLEAAAKGAGFAVEVTLSLENRGSETWDEAAGVFLSYQVFDAESENLLIDGPRDTFNTAVAPGDAVTTKLNIELPPEPGNYKVFVSPLKEGEAWFFEHGAPFVLVSARVASGAITHCKASITSLSRLRVRRFFRSIKRAFVYPVRAMVEHRSLIRSMVRRDILGRYRGSFGGLFWTVINPLLLMITYYFVFGIVLQTRFGSDDNPANFLLYFLAGMLPWLALSEAVGRAPTTVIEHSNFVKKLRFPVETLPVNLVIAGLVSELFGVAIFLVSLYGFGRPPSAEVIYLPLILVPQFLLTLGLCWFLAATGVFFRDLGQIIGFVLTIWFFTTPICYPEESLPQSMRWLFQLNPMYVLVDGYRAVFLEASPPAFRPLAILTGISAALFILGHAWFYRLKKSFADMV